MAKALILCVRQTDVASFVCPVQFVSYRVFVGARFVSQLGIRLCIIALYSIILYASDVLVPELCCAIPIVNKKQLCVLEVRLSVDLGMLVGNEDIGVCRHACRYGCMHACIHGSMYACLHASIHRRNLSVVFWNEC